MAEAWIPGTYLELEEAVLDGRLHEGHTVDFKKELGTGAKANRDLAKDLAAFSIDGGQLFLGVDEPTGQPASMHPVVLAGLRERIDQVGRSSVSPPVGVRCVELQTDADPTRGALVVVIPPSADAPHQAAERFWGRSDTTNYVLSPQDVERLVARRFRQEIETEELLAAEILRDPARAAGMSERGHLYLVAQPDGVDPERLFRALDGQHFQNWFQKEVVHSAAPSRWAPDVKSVGTFSRRAGGWAVSDHCIDSARQVRANGDLPAREEHLLDVEIREDGGVRLFCARATDERRDYGEVAMDVVICGLTFRVVEIAGRVAERCGYLGGWRFAIGMTGMRGARSSTGTQNWQAGDPGAYSEDEYRRTYAASGEKVLDAPIEIVEALLGSFLRGVSCPSSPRELLGFRTE